MGFALATPLGAAAPCGASRLRGAPARAACSGAAPRRVRRSRRTAVRAVSLPGDDEPPAAPSDVRRLERLFERTVEAAPVLSPPLSPAAPRRALPPGTLPPLLLWRVPWTMLPGYREMLHVHAPASLALFDQVLAGPRPWRYAHLYTPDENAPPRRRNDPPGDDDAEGGPDAAEGGDDDDEEPPQPAPVHAVLMDVVAAERTADGRLYMVVRALARLRVRGPAGATPAGTPLVACELAPDSEETQAYAPLARAAARRAAAEAGVSADTVALRHDVVARAAGAAAGASALTWQAYFESAVAARDYARMQSRVVALAKAFFELSDVSAPPAAPPAEVAAAANAAARAAAAAAAAAALAESEPAAVDVLGLDADAASAEQAQPPAAEILPVELAMAETAMWAEYDAAVVLQRALSPGGVGTGAGGGSMARSLPRTRPPYAARVLRPLAPPAAAAALARLRPSPAPAGADEADGFADAARAPAPPVRPVPPPWPALRRASRASFAMACVLPEVSRGAGRQALLDAPSAGDRLRHVTRLLAARRATLAALSAVENARGMGGPNDGAV